ncbi:CocE/NonD family hydrolase [Ktedonobacter racemifer]|uniref:Hydrolase CocE/NonD family protein n=1 Tax=Ktedonobacter racemifer DSM 44963 TaxID=485913 RepID=D6TBR6_KTERA|nr:CocE/NonD family hydrolase [Ktedonobacter racemifer]EFH89848.1 hydrolase CocE/NonD family protein [Ktedonobacter racemifer DSM 44963]
MNILIEKNVMVPMRDGVSLATDVYRPAEGGPVPVLLARLPYNKDLPIMMQAVMDASRAVQAGYAVVFQDCRGRFASEGAFTPIVNEANDGADTVAWIAQQPWSTGQIGTVGGSYLGFTQWLLAREQPEALRAMAPAITTSDYYQAPWRHTGGVFELGISLSWSLGMIPEELQRQRRLGKASREHMDALMQMMGNVPAQFERLPLGDMPLLHDFAPSYFEWLAHPTYDDYWRGMAHKEYYEQITVPALNIGGWYDIFLGGTLENYTGMKQRGGSALARQHQRLLIGPWSHGGMTGVFPERTYGLMASGDAADLVGVQLRWYDHWLKGEDNGVEQEKPVKIFVMGLDQWREEEDWPLPDTQFRPYYLHSSGHANTAAGDGKLSTEAPAEEAEDVYLYDPRRPVPTVGGAILLSHGLDQGPRDQRSVEAREDVLCYSTPVLEEPVEVTGPIELVLSISSSARDTDFTGKLVDVYPNGRAEILTDGVLRARYRESFSEPRLLEPGQIYELRLNLWATSNLFKAGHRIRLEVSSSNFPRFDRNSNTGGTIETETEKEFVQAVNRVYHESAHPSYLVLPVIVRN